MHRKKNYVLFILIGITMLLSVFITTSKVQAKSDIKLKVISIKQKKNKIHAKVKISNDTKRFIEISGESVLYEKRNHKWKRMKWNKNHSTSDNLFGLEAGTSGKYTFIIDFDDLLKEVKAGKGYRIGIEVDGKYKKPKKSRLKNDVIEDSEYVSWWEYCK